MLSEANVCLITNNSLRVKQMETYSKRLFVFLLTEKGISEFFTDGIIHCWNRHIITWNPTTTSTIRFTKNL